MLTKFKFHQNLTRLTGSILIVSRAVLLKIINISGKSCREESKYILNSVTYFFFFENRTVYEIMWKCMV